MNNLRTRMERDTEHVLAGAPRHDILALYAFLQSEDDEFAGSTITAYWGHELEPNEYGDPVNLTIESRFSIDHLIFEFNQEGCREISATMGVLSDWLDGGYGL